MTTKHAVAVAMIGVAALVSIGAGLQLGPANRRSVMDGLYTLEQAKRGRGYYDRRCVLCHLDRGQGHEAMPEIVGQSLEREGDPEAPPVAGEVFQKKWGSRNAWELFSTMTSTMPVGAPRSLSPQEYADVLAYMFELNKFPAGPQELTPERAGLEIIAIGR
jgi:cytochrome c